MQRTEWIGTLSERPECQKDDFIRISGGNESLYQRRSFEMSLISFRGNVMEGKK